MPRCRFLKEAMMFPTPTTAPAEPGGLTALLVAFLVAGAGYADVDGPTSRDSLDPCPEAPALVEGESVRSLLVRTKYDCYAVELRVGEYLKVTVEGIGMSAAAELWLPGSLPEGGPPAPGAYGRGEVRGGVQVLTAVVAQDGTHWVTVGPIRDGGPAVPYRIELTERLPPEGFRERLEEAKSDPRVEWLRENVVAIRSITPGDEGFSDLMPLEEILEEVEVVMLGEVTHWDAPTYHAKTRLVKFLHQEMGFDAVVFEADFYSMWKMWQAIEEGESPRELVRQRMHGMYNVAEFEPFLEYVEEAAASERPLELAGADPFAVDAGETFLRDLESFLERIGVDVDSEPTYQRVRDRLRQVYEARDEWGILPADQPFGEAEISASAQEVAALQQVLRSRSPGDRQASFWIQVLNDIPNWLERWVAFSEILSKYPEENLLTVAEAARADLDSNWDWHLCKSLKDKQMADHVIWLAEEYFAGRKIIVWAHTGHLHRNPFTLRPLGLLDEAMSRCVYQLTRLNAFTVMGHDVHAALGDRVYTLGFTSYEGEFRGGRPINRAQVEELELEEMFYLAGHEYALLDLRWLGQDGAWLHDRLYARTVLPRTLQARWPAVLDGFLFIRETYPTERRPLR